MLDDKALLETIKTDIALWNKIHNKDAMVHSRMWVEKEAFIHDSDSPFYELRLNEGILWYGTLREINAIVKSMIIRIQNKDFL